MSKEPSPSTPFTQTGAAVVNDLGSDSEQGLTTTQVRERQQQYGANELAVRLVAPAWKRLLRQFNNLLIYVLLVAAVLAGVLTEWLDMAVILAVVVANAAIGFVQEGRAEHALSAIQNMLTVHAIVIRDGKKQQVLAKELVPGDLIVLEAGDKVPADVRLLHARNLHTQEAALTGESVPVAKNVHAVSADAVLAERSCMAYSGTLVTQGRASAVVVAIGGDTELGRINKLLNRVTTLTTPLLEQMSQFARYLTLVVIAIGLAVFALGLMRGNDPAYLFMAVVSLIVAAIPEGLPTILTVALAIGVTRMAARHSVIRRLPAVETLGAVSTICSDKTGTLTRNEMMVSEVYTQQGRWQVTGSGYSLEGKLLALDQRAEQAEAADKLQPLTGLALAGALCNDAHMGELQGKDGSKGDGPEITGDPMEAALLVLAHKTMQNLSRLQEDFPRLDSIPFDSRHKYMATLHAVAEQVDVSQWFATQTTLTQSAQVIFIKGAPERVLAMCTLSPTEKEQQQKQIERIAAAGQRVLGFAVKWVDGDVRELSDDMLADNIEFLGFCGLIDPPRPEAQAAIAICKEAGVHVKMITGDHAATAKAIGQDLGLEHTSRVLEGHDIETMSDDDLRAQVLDVDIFARTTPEHKLRLVTALQAHGQVVAMTGDGVNDAPALKRADVGIAMGKGGTEAAREASEMVLIDDNFATIVDAVKEGRNVYDNLKKAMGFLLPVNGGESLAIVLALLFALTLPILPLQILWVNMVSSIALALALAFEPAERDIMRRPPRQKQEALISRFLLWRIVLVSVLFTIGIFAAFQWALANGYSESYARTFAVNTLVAMEVWYLFSVRYLRRGSLFKEGVKGTKAVLIAVSLVFVLQLAFTYSPVLQRLFQTESLLLVHGLATVLIGIAVFLILELEKALRQRMSVYQKLKITN